MIVTTTHLFTIPWFTTRRGFCRWKSREWFVRHGLDWKQFVREGIDASALEATGDGLALALVAWAREYEAKEAARG